MSQAFWHACGAGQRRTAEYLLGRGADLAWEPDYAQGTALDAATGAGTRQENVITWLRELERPQPAECCDAQTPMGTTPANAVSMSDTDVVGVGDHRHVTARDLDRWWPPCAWRTSARHRGDRLRRRRRPCTRTGSDFHAGVPITSPKVDIDNGCCTACITLAWVGSTSGAKWLTKSSSGSQAKLCSSTNEMSKGRGARPSPEQGTEGFALVEPERGDVDQAHHVRASVPSAVDDLAAVRVGHHDRRAVLECQHLAQPGHVIGERGLRELG